MTAKTTAVAQAMTSLQKAFDDVEKESPGFTAAFMKELIPKVKLEEN